MPRDQSQPLTVKRSYRVTAKHLVHIVHKSLSVSLSYGPYSTVLSLSVCVSLYLSVCLSYMVHTVLY